MNPEPLKGAIIGLGNIGFGFNADRKRRGVWTHERAFERSGRVRLIAVADPNPDMRQRFTEARPDVAAYATTEDLLREHAPDIASICVPTKLHEPLVRRCADAGVKAIFCEKPLAADPAQARRLVDFCRRKGVVLAVNHTRRWDPAYRRAAQVIHAGGIGQVRSISARYSGHVLNVGTHLIDAVRMLSGLSPVRACGFGHGPTDDPHVYGTIEMTGGVGFSVSCHGTREDMIFEIDLVGREGRLRLVKNGLETIFERFVPSRHYSGYREPRRATLPSLSRRDRFIEAIRDVATCAKSGAGKPACAGEDGYYALATAWALQQSARGGGKSVKIEPI